MCTLKLDPFADFRRASRQRFPCPCRFWSRARPLRIRPWSGRGRAPPIGCLPSCRRLRRRDARSSGPEPTPAWRMLWTSPHWRILSGLKQRSRWVAKWEERLFTVKLWLTKEEPCEEDSGGHSGRIHFLMVQSKQVMFLARISKKGHAAFFQKLKKTKQIKQGM